MKMVKRYECGHCCECLRDNTLQVKCWKRYLMGDK